MATARTRRKTPLKKPSGSRVRTRRNVKPSVEWRDLLMKSLIGLLLIVDVVLIIFIVRQCSKPVMEIVEESEPEPPRILQIEVLNGCGVTGIAAHFTDHLRAQGFDVVKTDNYESFGVQRTVVIDRKGSIPNSVRIAESLGLDESRVLQEVNEAYLIDATVVLGRDFRQLPCWQTMERSDAR